MHITHVRNMRHYALRNMRKKNIDNIMALT